MKITMTIKQTPVHLKRVDVETFEGALKELSDSRRSYISKHFGHHHTCYLAYESLTSRYPTGGFCFEHQKNDIIYLKGVFSLRKGFGKIMLINIFALLSKYQTFRINCIGEKLKEYYKQFGFKVYLKQPSIDIPGEVYYEMLLDRSKKKGSIK